MAKFDLPFNPATAVAIFGFALVGTRDQRRFLSDTLDILIDIPPARMNYFTSLQSGYAFPLPASCCTSLPCKIPLSPRTTPGLQDALSSDLFPVPTKTEVLSKHHGFQRFLTSVFSNLYLFYILHSLSPPFVYISFLYINSVLPSLSPF